MRQSLVLLKDGKGYAVITKRGLTIHGPEVKIAMREDGARRPEDKDQRWLDENVIGIWPELGAAVTVDLDRSADFFACCRS